MKTANTTPDLDPTAFDPDGIAKAWIDILPSLPPEPGQHLIQRSGERGIVVDVSRYNSATGPEVGLIKVWSPTEGESEFWTSGACWTDGSRVRPPTQIALPSLAPSLPPAEPMHEPDITSN